MLTISGIKMKVVIIKYKFFTFSKREKELCLEMIKELSFKSSFEKDIVTILRDKGWTLEAFVMLILTTVEIIKLIISR